MPAVTKADPGLQAVATYIIRALEKDPKHYHTGKLNGKPTRYFRGMASGDRAVTATPRRR